MIITMSDNNNSRENYDFDSLGTLENVLDNNLSKSKKEAVLLRRMTDRRRKPSKKFRHNQNSRSIDYSNNEFLDEFLDHTSINLKKSNSMNLLDIIDDRNLMNRSINEIEKVENRKYQQVKLRPAEEATNRRRISPPLLIANAKTYSVGYLPTPNLSNTAREESFTQEKSIESYMKDEIEIKISLSSEIDLNTNRTTKNPLFNVSIDQIQSELGKLKVIEKSTPKIIKFNPTEVTPQQEISTNVESGKPKVLYSKSMHNITKNGRDNKIPTKNITVVDSAFKSESISFFESKTPDSSSNIHRLRSNSFQRSPSLPKTSENTSRQQPTQNNKMTTTIKQNENSENIKPQTPKILQQQTSNFQPSNAFHKKTKIDSITSIEPLSKTVINVTSNTPISNKNQKPSNVIQVSQVAKNPIQTPSSPNNVLTENNNNNKLSESNSNIPSWKLELMKRKRNFKEDDKIPEKQQASLSTLPDSKPSPNLTILVTPELKKTVIQTNSLKPTFQSNFVNYQPIKSQNKKESEKLTSPPPPISTNTPLKTTITLQNNSKLIHNSIGSPIVLLTTTTTTPIVNTITEQPKQYTTNDTLIPEWKRTLLEKKKLKKTF